MRKQHILISCVVVAVAAALLFGFWYFRPHTDVSSAPVPSICEGRGVVHEIEYTDEGYSPNPLSIAKCDTVRFVNHSSEAFWPAAALHPTHSLYPEHSENDCLGSSFDACAALPSGSTWEFTFVNPGSWRFHDHLKAYHTGLIEVGE